MDPLKRQIRAKGYHVQDREYRFPFTPQQDGQYAVCIKAINKFGKYRLVYEFF